MLDLPVTFSMRTRAYRRYQTIDFSQQLCKLIPTILAIIANTQLYLVHKRAEYNSFYQIDLY